MIPPEFALSAWLVISFFLMIDRNSVRGFSLAMILGLFFLPMSGDLKVSLLPTLTKTDAMVLGVLMGTIVFHPNLVLQFRPHIVDLLLLALLVCSVVTSVVNGLGVYDGFSSAYYCGTGLLAPIFLARIHLGSPKRLRQFLIYLVIGSACYAPLTLWEFRMSPQIHHDLYGEFQHEFAQFARNDWWRPVVCFPHALDLGRFFALCAFLAAFPLRSDLARRYPYGQWIFVAPLVGLAISMSYGPYLMFAALIGLYYLPRRLAPLAYLLPGAAFLWVVLLFMDVQVLKPVVDTVAHQNAERAASFQYRLDAFYDYSRVIRQQIAFGYGGWSRGRIAGVATDSKLLIDLLQRGLAGAVCIYGWWFWSMWTAYRLAAKTAPMPFGRLAYSLAGVAPICLAFAVFDAGLDPQVVLIAGAVLAIYPPATSSAPVHNARHRPADSAITKADALSFPEDPIATSSS